MDEFILLYKEEASPDAKFIQLASPPRRTGERPFGPRERAASGSAVQHTASRRAEAAPTAVRRTLAVQLAHLATAATLRRSPFCACSARMIACCARRSRILTADSRSWCVSSQIVRIQMAPKRRSEAQLVQLPPPAS